MRGTEVTVGRLPFFFSPLVVGMGNVEPDYCCKSNQSGKMAKWKGVRVSVITFYPIILNLKGHFNLKGYKCTLL